MSTPLEQVDGLLEVEYNVFTVAAAGAAPGSQRRPYRNGVVTAADGTGGTVAVVVTGLFDGEVRVRAELWAEPPRLPDLDRWQDAAEVAVDWPGGRVRLLGADVLPFPELIVAPALPAGRYRLRVAGRHRDDGEARLPDAPVEEYLLQIWPAGADTEDRLLKSTSGVAARWTS